MALCCYLQLNSVNKYILHKFFYLKGKTLSPKNEKLQQHLFNESIKHNLFSKYSMGFAMKKRNTAVSTIISIFIAIFIFSGCSDSGDGTATIVIDLGKNKSTSSMTKGLTDDPSAPSGITGIYISVTGPGIFLLSKKITLDTHRPNSISSDGTVAMEIPSGVKRLIEVIMEADAGQYLGTATVDLEAGTTVGVSIVMKPNYFKLVIPDYNNNRIVRIDDMSGSGWIARDGDSMFGRAIIYPYDLEQDKLGRIYIADSNSSGFSGEIHRLDDFHAVPNTIVESSELIVYINEAPQTPHITALAVDSKRKRLYFYAKYASTYRLYSSDLNGENLFSNYFNVPNNIQGMAVDESTGLLYFACAPDGYEIVQYDPLAVDCVKGCSYGERGLSFLGDNFYPLFGVSDKPWDVMVKGSSIYVANYGEDNILQLSINSNNELVANAGLGGGRSLMFYGPRRFVGIFNRKLYVINDNDSSFTPHAEINAMDNMKGSGWESYGEYGYSNEGKGYFRFFGSLIEGQGTLE